MAHSSNKVIKNKIHEIIFEADTPAGKHFDIILLVCIVCDVIVVMLESVDKYNNSFHDYFIFFEWVFTIFFTVEYILRLYSTLKPMKYATSFFGVIDLLAILPAYLSLVVAGSQGLVMIRLLRLFRIFRIFKMMSFLRHGKMILLAMRNSIPKITIFLIFVSVMVCIFGSVMYMVEGGSNEKFDSIPRSIYWAIVTITTVGYGDISPATSLGQFIASVVMMIGYAVIAVPTGIVTVELSKSHESEETTQSCRFCSQEGHDEDAIHCKYCGEILKFEEE